MTATTRLYGAVVWLCLISGYTAFNLTLIYKGNTNSMALLALSPIWYAIAIAVLKGAIKDLQGKSEKVQQ